MSEARRKRGGRRARGAESTADQPSIIPYIKRQIPEHELLDEEGLSLIEYNADTILEEVGIDFRYPPALKMFKDAGADIDGERVRFPRGMCRKIIQDSAPAEFEQKARNPSRNVRIGGKNTVFAPVYGPPFVRDLDKGRRYAMIEDFRNFVKLAYMLPSLHHSGGTVCEPTDVPVNKRHLDIVLAHLTLSDKPFMGGVTSPQRAQDSIHMARLTFGADFMERHAVIQGNINVNSPLVYDDTMSGALRVYAQAGQCVCVSPAIFAGAMGPLSPAAVAAQTLAEAMVGIALAQLVRPGCPVVFGSFHSTMN
ncbi:MAG: trimethylamine methyltransferase family protein, partial [Pseudomonadota bacterium]